MHRISESCRSIEPRSTNMSAPPSRTITKLKIGEIHKDLKDLKEFKEFKEFNGFKEFKELKEF